MSLSPQDKVERVLKEIHIAFSQSPTYNGEPNKMIMDRLQFMNLLDRLNNGIYDMMNQYELTQQGRMNAERAFRRKSDEIIEQANKSADDIYAASVIYTADTIGRIRDLMDQTNNSMNDLFRQFRKELRDQKDLLRAHETELQSQLVDLADTKKYLSVLQDLNKERGELPAAPESKGGSVEVKVNDEYFEKTGKPKPGSAKSDGADKPEIKVNTDAEYFKWKAAKEGKPAAADSAPEPKKEEPKSLEKLLEAEAMEETPVSNGEFPDEEAIRKMVMEDELQMEFGQDAPKGKEGSKAGSILKTIIFGKE